MDVQTKYPSFPGIVPRRLIVLVHAFAAVFLLTTCGYAGDKTDRVSSFPDASQNTLAVLAPDSVSSGDPRLTVWLDAASEEGLHALAVRDSDLEADMGHYAGVILPDGLHVTASDALLATLKAYVQSGGNLMLVYDGATMLPGGGFAARSRLSDLVGIDYAIHGSTKVDVTRRAGFWGTAAVMDALEIPPGKAMPAAPDLNTSGQEQLASLASENPIAQAEVSSSPLRPAYYTMDTYSYGHVAYTSFVTQGTYAGEKLLQSEAGLVAGFERHGKGSVLFVNLPLGYLALRTDALLLHGFLHYFSQQIGLPSLAAVPDGVGGVVLNWHLCAGDSQSGLPLLEKLGFFEQGPYSFHFTAGPDRDKIGDGMGMDLANNLEMQRWVHFLEKRGNAIGNHGGWAHNVFGLNLNEDNEADFRHYLELNTAAVEKVAGHPIREYSAPQGNHPTWVTRWLDEHGFVGYYFTGDTGLGPTRTYRNGQRSNPWAFPVATLGKAASLEDMHFSRVPDAEVTAWLRGMSDFVSRQRVSRLIYMHPPGAKYYPDALRSWLSKTGDLKQRGVFRWYTMSGLADFLNARQQVQWQAARSRDGKSLLITATHPRSLEHQTWFLPREAYDRPRVLAGGAHIEKQADRWIIIADDGNRLVFSARLHTLHLERLHEASPEGRTPF